MQNTNARSTLPFLPGRKSLAIAVILVILTLLGLLAVNFSKTARLPAPPAAATILSQPMLAERYGLKVNLVAVTAAGGMVDVRLGVTDGAKAKTLLEDQANFPTLLVGDGIVLRAAEDVAAQPIKFEDGSHVFVLYPNAQNTVLPGDPVTIVFGDIRVEAIAAK